VPLFNRLCVSARLGVCGYALTIVSLFAGGPVRQARAVEHDRPAGQPYELAGKRLVFTSWYFVRPGQPDWQTPDGESVYAARAEYDADVLRYLYRDRPFGIRLAVEPAERRGPVIVRDRPWESIGLGPGTLMADAGKYRLWGYCRSGEKRATACYLESNDGRTWTRPDLGVVAFDDSKANNLLDVRLGGVFKDPSAPPEARYKSARHGQFASADQFEQYRKKHPFSMMATEMDVGKTHAIIGAISPDGLHWTELPEPIGVEPTDTQVIAYYDTRLDKYVMYTRTYMLGPRAPGFPPPSPEMYQLLARRSIGRTENDVFNHFPPAQSILEPTPEMSPTDQIYTNCRTTIPGAPDQHVFFPTIFHLESDTTSVVFYGSYDGRLLHKLPGGPVLTTADYGQWDGGCVFAHPNLVELPDGSWALPYTGFPRPHKYPHANAPFDFGLAVWPKGRLVAICADDEGGFTTPAIMPPGTRVKINALTKRVGHVLVEAADLSGKPLPGRSFAEATPIKGDCFWTPVQWGSTEDLGVAADQPVVLRFRMKMAKFYGLEFE
jgi:hypothetical protein